MSYDISFPPFYLYGSSIKAGKYQEKGARTQYCQGRAATMLGHAWPYPELPHLRGAYLGWSRKQLPDALQNGVLQRLGCKAAAKQVVT